MRNSSSAASDSANTGPRSAANTINSSSGRSIAPSRLRSAITSSRSLNDPPLTSTCGRCRASSARRYGRVTSRPNEFIRRNRIQICRGRIGTRTSGASRSVTVHPLSCTSHRAYAAIASGIDWSILKLTTRPKSPYGSGTGSTTIDGCVAGAARYGVSGAYAAACPIPRSSAARTRHSPSSESPASRESSPSDARVARHASAAVV